MFSKGASTAGVPESQRTALELVKLLGQNPSQ